jgi:hypothetical protein
VPNSFLWIGLVVLWLFVLFPMLADRHPRIRRTTDAALATRVLHRGDAKHAVKQDGPAVHDSYSDWDQAEDWMDDENDVDDAGALVPLEPGYHPDDFVPDRRGRGRFDPDADADAAAGRYAYRQRMVLFLAILTVGCAIGGLVLSHLLWLVATVSVLLLAGYLAYLRHQVRLEQDIRNRRLARLQRNDTHRSDTHRSEDHAADHRNDDELVERRIEPGGEDAYRRDRDFHLDRAVTLEADDEDPVFEYLDLYDHLNAPVHRPDDHDLRRAAGE